MTHLALHCAAGKLERIMTEPLAASRQVSIEHRQYVWELQLTIRTNTNTSPDRLSTGANQ